MKLNDEDRTMLTGILKHTHARITQIITSKAIRLCSDSNYVSKFPEIIRIETLYVFTIEQLCDDIINNL